MANGNFAILLAAASIVFPISANADIVTYDFSGTVTSATGMYAGLAPGTAVTGTYNFDLANEHAGQSVSTSSSWAIDAVATADLFWATVQAGQFSDSTNVSAGPGPNGGNNFISGHAPVVGESYGWTYFAGAAVGNAATDSISLYIAANPGSLPFTTAGLPL
jgi:hypothetical protein